MLATRRLGLVAFAWLIFQTSHATANACWKELHFAASNSWVAATTVIQYQTMATATAVAELQGATALPVLPATSSAIGKIHVTFSAARSQGELDTWFDPGNGAVLQSLRTTQGRDRRQKLYRFASDGVWRERREPAPASGWIPTNSRQIAYPVTISTDDPVITPLMLIDHAARLVRDAQTNSSTHLVFTDTQLYRVTLELAPEQNLAAKFTLVEDGREHADERIPRRTACFDQRTIARHRTRTGPLQPARTERRTGDRHRCSHGDTTAHPGLHLPWSRARGDHEGGTRAELPAMILAVAAHRYTSLIESVRTENENP